MHEPKLAFVLLGIYMLTGIPVAVKIVGYYCSLVKEYLETQDFQIEPPVDQLVTYFNFTFFGMLLMVCCILCWPLIVTLLY